MSRSSLRLRSAIIINTISRSITIRIGSFRIKTQEFHPWWKKIFIIFQHLIKIVLVKMILVRDKISYLQHSLFIIWNTRESLAARWFNILFLSCLLFEFLWPVIENWVVYFDLDLRCIDSYVIISTLDIVLMILRGNFTRTILAWCRLFHVLIWV
jgi:hypothetical protein